MHPDSDGHSTIAAIATPEGRGGLSIIRISGSRALFTARRIFKPARASSVFKPWKTIAGAIVDPDRNVSVDEVLTTYFKAPASYTGEDVVEISCHGNPVIADSILTLILKTGVRMAAPGEFTRRAFENGRIDLGRAEAVAMMTSAESLAELTLAMKMLQGGLSKPVQRIREKILHVMTAVELDLDFPEEPVSISRSEVTKTLRETRSELSHILEAGYRGDTLRKEREIVLAGRVNVGKSSVFNRLMARDKAIVSNEPGTTRDVLEAYAEWGESKITLMDTAGLRTSDSIAETLAVQRSADSLKTADLIVYIVDGTCPDIPLLEHVTASVPETNIIVFWNKTDIAPSPSGAHRERLSGIHQVISVIEGSAITGQGIDRLRKKITAMMHTDDPNAGDLSLMITLRQQQSLVRAQQSIEEAIAVFDAEDGSECAAPMLRNADYLLGTILGDTASPDVLGTIFSAFCIGK